MWEILLDWSNFCALANLEVLRREIEIRKFCNWVTQEKWFWEKEIYFAIQFFTIFDWEVLMNFKCDVWWSILCAGGWLLYLVIYLLLVSVCIKFSRGLWKWKTNIGWECGAITGLLGRVENLYLIKHKLHSLWKQLKTFNNVIWNNQWKHHDIFSMDCYCDDRWFLSEVKIETFSPSTFQSLCHNVPLFPKMVHLSNRIPLAKILNIYKHFE